jgi:Pectate lyase superfamily protein
MKNLVKVLSVSLLFLFAHEVHPQAITKLTGDCTAVGPGSVPITCTQSSGVPTLTTTGTATVTNKNMSGLTNSFSFLPKPKFNVMDYASGVAINTCSGTAPDGSAAFQAAFDAATAHGGTVYVPVGSYCISSTITESSAIPVSVSIQGDPQGNPQITWTRSPTVASVAITGTAGQFSCTCTNLNVGDSLIISGTAGGSGSISGYSTPAIYYVSATNGTSTFTLQAPTRAALTTVAGTLTGLTYIVQPSLFYMKAWGNSSINQLYLNSSTPYLVAFDIDSDTTGNQGGESLTFRNILFTDTAGGAIGWRFGETDTGNGDFSFENFENASCTLGGINSVCFLNLRQDGLDWNWYGGRSYGAASDYTGGPQYSGQGLGGGSMSFYGFGSSGTTDTDFYFNGGGSYAVFGGRFELGSRFLATQGGINSNNVVVDGANLGAYKGNVNAQVFSLNSSGTVALRGLQIYDCIGSNCSNGLYTSQMLNIVGQSGYDTDVIVSGGSFGASDPFYSIGGSGGNIRVSIKNATLLASGGITASGQATNIEYSQMPTVTSGGGTSPTFTGTNANSFILNEGTGTPSATLTLAMPIGNNSWICAPPSDLTTTSVTGKQTGTLSTTAVTITFSSAPTTGDKISFPACSAPGGSQ